RRRDPAGIDNRQARGGRGRRRGRGRRAGRRDGGGHPGARARRGDMSRVLLVTQSTRSMGEFRRPWVRALHGRYVRRFRRELDKVVARLAPEGEVTVLTSRELVDPEAMPATVTLRYFDDESFQVTAETVGDVTDHLESAIWPERGRELALDYRGVWLPD